MQEETRKFAPQSSQGPDRGGKPGPSSKAPLALLRCQDLSKLKGPTGAEIRLHDSSIMVGRTEDNDAIVKGEGVSRKHARIAPESGEWVVIDLESTNGVRVNGSRVSRHILQDGDAVTFGRVVYIYEVLERAASDTPSLSPPVFERTVVLATRPHPQPAPASPPANANANASGVTTPQYITPPSASTTAGAPSAVTPRTETPSRARAGRRRARHRETPESGALWVLVLLVAAGLVAGAIYLFSGGFAP